MIEKLRNIKKALIFADVLIAFAFIFMLANKFMTIYMINDLTDTLPSQEEVNNLIKYVEGNPLMAWAFTLDRYYQLLFNLIIPALMIGAYYLTRKRINDISVINALALTIFLMLLTNFVNDGAHLLAFLGRS